MVNYQVAIDDSALDDIQRATDWDNSQSSGLGTRFQKQVRQQINNLKSNAPAYSIRYANVRCTRINKFPFLVHFTLNEVLGVVEVFAVIHTSRNPLIWE